MINKILLIWLCLVVAICDDTFAQQKSANSIKLKLQYEGQSISVNNNLEIYFVSQQKDYKTIIKPKIEVDSFIYPDLCGYDLNYVYIVLKYKNLVFAVGTVDKVYDINMVWTIGIDKKPFVKEYYDPSPNAKTKRTEGIFYIEFDPLIGDGFVSTVTPSNWNSYLKESRDVLDIDHR